MTKITFKIVRTNNIFDLSEIHPLNWTKSKSRFIPQYSASLIFETKLEIYNLHIFAKILNISNILTELLIFFLNFLKIETKFWVPTNCALSFITFTISHLHFLLSKRTNIWLNLLLGVKLVYKEQIKPQNILWTNVTSFHNFYKNIFQHFQVQSRHLEESGKWWNFQTTHRTHVKVVGSIITEKFLVVNVPTSRQLKNLYTYKFWTKIFLVRL